MTLVPVSARLDPVDVWYFAAGEQIPDELANRYLGFSVWGR